jgi:CDP-4-dehydro-6-deoxyglucose reductase, E3
MSSTTSVVFPTPEQNPETVTSGRVHGAGAPPPGKIPAPADGAASFSALWSAAMVHRHYDAHVETVEPLSDWVLRLVLRVESERPFHFEPGQYVSLHRQENGKEIIRHFSIASPPTADNRIELCIAEGTPIARQGGTGPKMGECLRLSGPGGSFRLKEPLAGDLLFIATGTGISPFRPMIARALEIGAAGERVDLLYGIRSQDDILFCTELEALARRDSRFHFHPTLSRPNPGWAGLVGHVQSHVAHALAGRTDLDVYLCGRKEMLLGVRPLLAEYRIPAERIHHERYS